MRDLQTAASAACGNGAPGLFELVTLEQYPSPMKYNAA
jgi:hypothetical protein